VGQCVAHTPPRHRPRRRRKWPSLSSTRALGDDDEQVVISLLPLRVPPNHPARPLLHSLPSFRHLHPLLSIFVVVDSWAVVTRMQGRWWWWQAVETVEETTSSSRLNAREVVAVADGRNGQGNHLRLAFGSEGGGGGSTGG